MLIWRKQKYVLYITLKQQKEETHYDVYDAWEVVQSGNYLLDNEHIFKKKIE
jgi:hypothetical protein